jgi:MFS transporter, DHA2 family, multidrug resistance protein
MTPPDSPSPFRVEPPAGEWRPSFNPWLIAASVMLATFMEVLDTTIVTVSLPHIAGSLSATPEESTWVLTSYLVSNAIILPTSTWLSSMIGRKRFYIICVVLFTVSSALCGAATSLGLLVVARVLQGVGGGALQPIAQTVLLESFPPARRGIAMAVFSMGVIVAPILGPTLGGWITDNYSWRWVFYVNLPIGVLAFLLAQLFVEDPPYISAARRTRMDYAGFGFMALGLAALQIVLDKGQEDDWFAAPWVRWFVVAAAVSLAAFIVRELTTDEPLVDLRIFADRNFAVGSFFILMLGVVLYSTTSMLPLFMQTLLGYPALDSGLAVSPRGLGAMVSAIVVGRLIGVVDSRVMIAAGFALVAASTYMYSELTLAITKSSIVMASVLNGMGTGMIFVPLSTNALGRLRNEQIGNASGIYNLMRNLGGGIGISVVTTLFARGLQQHQTALVAHLTPYDPAYQAWLETARTQLLRGAGSVFADQQALGMLGRRLAQQASLLTFLDNFRLVTVLSLACLPFLLLFARVRGRREVAAAHE